MRVFYLEKPLSQEDEAVVAEMFEATIEQVRIPHLLPSGDADESLEARFFQTGEAVEKLLRATGILADYGVQVGLVIPRDMMAFGALNEAIHRLTGFYPPAIQTADQRKALGCDGYLRILDMQGMMRG